PYATKAASPASARGAPSTLEIRVGWPRVCGGVSVPMRRGPLYQDIGVQMVALRRLPRDLPPPLDDGRPTRLVHPYDRIKMHLWGAIVNASAMAMKNKW